MSNRIIIAGKEFPVETRVVLWDEGPGFDARAERCINPSHSCPSGIYPYSEKMTTRRKNRTAMRPALRRYGSSPPLEAAQGVIKQFILHHDGCPSAKTCFNVLHNERGLSCHFLMDNDGTIYQTLDLAYMAFHAAGFNANSVGIELCNRGDAKKYPNYYSRGRGATTCRIHNHIYYAYEYTPQQIEAMYALAKGLARALPNLPLEFPQDSANPGQQSWSVIDNPLSFAGYLGHYHTTRRKWDPGPFDFKTFCEKARGSRCFPLFPTKKGSPLERPRVPERNDQLAEGAEALIALNERAEGGFFPVGPYRGDDDRPDLRLWHGGAHLQHPERGALVYAPFPGRVMAARMGPPSVVGSTNFVLLRHDMTIGKHSLRFFTLFFHLEDERGNEGADDAPGWLRSDDWKSYRDGVTTLLNEPVEGGDVIGRVGLGGPMGYQAPQIHFEVFAADNFMNRVQPGRWPTIDGTVGGRFSTSSHINDPIDTDSDGRLSRREVLDYFLSPNSKLSRKYVTLHVSEWIATPSWSDALQHSPEFSALNLSKEEIEELVEDQIEPTLWWTDEVARHARLPRDGVVYHFHPIELVKEVNDQLLIEKVLDVGIGAFDAAEAAETPEDVTDDLGDEDGSSFVNEAELTGREVEDIYLEDLVGGFTDE